MVWVLNVSSPDNCIYEVDPGAGVTGNMICPGGPDGFDISQRGLAYDPSDDTWYAGSWNDEMIHHFDSAGVLLDEVNVGLPIAGLAYNADTRHLFVMTNADPNPVFVLDAANNYAVIGQFEVAGMGPRTGAGLEFDCAGNLWAVNLISREVYQIESGEATSMCQSDVLWLATAPVTGTIAVGGTQNVVVTLDASAPKITQPGTYHAQLKTNHNTPYFVGNVPVTMTVTAPPTWGKLTGAVAGLPMCDTPPGTTLVGATVAVQGQSGMTLTVQTAADGRYVAWMDAADSPLTVTVSHAGYVTQTVSGIAVTAQQTTTQDIALRLDAPCLSVTPGTLSVPMVQGATATRTLIIANTGAGPLAYRIDERLSQPLTSSSSPEAAGNVVRSWPSGLAQAWGIAYDRWNNSVWVSSPGSSWGGTSTIHEYSPPGVASGRSHPYAWSPADGPADMAYNWNTDMLWVMNVNDPDNCIYEIDPATGATGDKICPGGASGFALPQRGLAYDPVDDTWYAGGLWDQTIHHFDSAGVILDEVNVGLPIVGLAYNPSTRHLYVMVNASPTQVYVLDVANGYASLGAFGVTGMGAFAGAGLEFDCDGRLWAVNKSTQMVYQFESGEATTLCNVPWLSAAPASGTLAAGSQDAIQVTFDASGLAEGVHRAILTVANVDRRDQSIQVNANLTVGHGLYLPWVAR
jgi:hypothetical protein